MSKDYDENLEENENEIDVDNDDEKEENKKGLRIILIIIGIVLIVFGAVRLGYYVYSQYNAKQESEQYTEVTSETQETVKNPVDFPSLQKKNDEIYAWLKVPGTKVDYPVVQSSKDDAFYLKHSALTKKWAASGAIYTEMVNSKAFDDRVTVIYGHNGYSDTMFTTLHNFEKKSFFDKHPKFYIYTPDSKLTYEIVSAFKYDNRHIMNSFDFRDNNAYNDFITMIQNPASTVKNVRKDLDKSLTLNDNIVVLSTCFTNQRSNRYLVCGVLVKNEKTD